MWKGYQFLWTGDSERIILKKMGFEKTTIHNIIAKYKKTGAVSIAPRSGRPKLLTERDKRHLKTIITRNWREPVNNIVKTFAESTGKVICKNTMKSILYKIGYNSHTVLRKPNISERN